MTMDDMNIHISKDLVEKWPQYEFVGKPFKLKNGRTYMRAFHKTFSQTHFYSFDEDFFWFDKPDTDRKLLV